VNETAAPSAVFYPGPSACRAEFGGGAFTFALEILPQTAAQAPCLRVTDGGHGPALFEDARGQAVIYRCMAIEGISPKEFRPAVDDAGLRFEPVSGDV
jgi:hypothetical protein